MRDTNGNHVFNILYPSANFFMGFRINKQQSLIFLSVFHVLPFGFGHVAGFVPETVLQGQETDRVTSTQLLPFRFCVQKTGSFVEMWRLFLKLYFLHVRNKQIKSKCK